MASPLSTPWSSLTPWPLPPGRGHSPRPWAPVGPRSARAGRGCPRVAHGRREQALEKRYPGLFKPRVPRGLLHGNAVETLIKKRNVPQKLSPHGKR